MKKTIALLLVFGVLLNARLNAQFLLLDDMEGNGPCSGRWTYYAGANATGSVLFNVPNPAPSTVNPSSHVARFIKDTSCFEYMSASCSMPQTFDLMTNSIFKMLVYSNTREEVMFKLQPGNDYTKAVFFTYRPTNINQWEEATFNFQSVRTRTDFDRIAVQFIDGKKANGILYFDLVQAPNPTGITLTNTSIAMGQEDGRMIEAKLNGDLFNASLTTSNWVASNLPSGVSIGSVQRINDTVANIFLSGNSPANYSRTILKLAISGQELQNPNTTSYNAKGNIVFDGNPNWTMVYSDEFDTDGIPDQTKWTVDPKPKAWINGEQQVYTDTSHDNALVKNGNLIIKGKRDFPNGNSTDPWSSARVISQGKMDFLYGKVEVRAKLPRARGSWPAIWLMPTNSAYGGWPKSGEIDIMEHVGNNFGNVMSTVHTQNNNWTNGGHLSGSKIIPDADTVYHVYAVEWAPDSLRFTYDGIKCYTYVNPHTDWKDWPFDKSFHVILNVAIGGGMGGSIVATDWPDSMTVDYVRISQKGLGTPVLDTIMVTPANVSVLSGKTQQYTAKVLDQNGHTMNITPVWSITGSGNSISATGLATINASGIVTATATADSITATGATNVNVRITNYKPVPARIEAENFDNSNSCCTEPTADTSGVLNVGYIGKGTWFEYDIDVPDSSAYRIRFRVAVSAASSLKIQLDTTTLATVNLPASGGWQKWITVTSAPVVFGPGQKTIRITSNTSGWNFNWLQVVPADSVRVHRIVVQPDSAKIIVGETKQFTATGYSSDSSYIMLSPAPVWTISGTGNSISTDGLFSTDSTGNYTVTAAISNTMFGTAYVNIVPVPILTRIAITPDTVTVPLGASQQFIAKGYDQTDSIMAITPVWSVTGAGNAINANGVFTAGNNLGNFIVTASANSLSDTSSVSLAYTCTVNNKHEAESASAVASGPYLQTCTDTGGGQNYAGLASGHWFAYNTLNVPINGKYTVRLRVLTTAPAKAKVGHSGLTFGIIDIPSTGGLWQTISDTMTLPALTYTGISVSSGTFKFNWFSIDNCAVPPRVLTRIELSADTVNLPNGQTYQFTATGYDQDNSSMPLPSPVWTVSDTNNTISSSGLVTANAAPGTYKVTVSSGTVTTAAWINILSCTVNTKYEAESFSARHPSPYLQTCTDIGGGQNFAGLAAGHWFAYNTLNVPSDGLYRISFRISSTAPSQVKVAHSGLTFGVIDIPSTGGVWQTITDTITLPALSYTGIHVSSGTFKFNWFSIDNCVVAPRLLQRIELSPATLNITSRQTQQFTATGYDQNDQPMPVPSQAWTVSGTGNTISSSGLLTAGTVPGSYTVTIISDSISATATVNLSCTVNDKYEAETASARHPGPYLQTCTDIGGGQNFARLYTGMWFAYNTLNVPAAGLYTISFRVLSTAPAKLSVGHNGMTFGIINVPSTGGVWQTIKDTITLPALTYTGIHVKSGSIKFNWFAIDNCETVTPGSSSNRSAAGNSKEAITENLSSNLNVYPNPTNGHILIKPGNNVFNIIKLFDINGRLIHQWKIIPGESTIRKDLSFLKNGIYMLKLEGINKQQTVRIVKL